MSASERPTVPIPPPPPPDAARMAECFDALAHTVHGHILALGGDHTAQRLGLEVAHGLRRVGLALGLPSAEMIAAGLLRGRE